MLVGTVTVLFFAVLYGTSAVISSDDATEALLQGERKTLAKDICDGIYFEIPSLYYMKVFIEIVFRGDF